MASTPPQADKQSCTGLTSTGGEILTNEPIDPPRLQEPAFFPDLLAVDLTHDHASRMMIGSLSSDPDLWHEDESVPPAPGTLHSHADPRSVDSFSYHGSSPRLSRL